jgi:DNA relaxase NicK
MLRPLLRAGTLRGGSAFAFGKKGALGYCAFYKKADSSGAALGMTYSTNDSYLLFKSSSGPKTA